ncbi:MAG TPA: bifunctional riboflavin kinase/FAD synthetase [Actinomycetota bacterium]
MEVLQGSASLPVDGPTAVTVGFFDGVHRGHQAVIGRTVDVARRRDLTPVAVTFDRHPREVLTPGDVPRLLTTLRRKAELIEALGVEVLLVHEFTPEVAGWPPADFVRRILARGLRARHAAVGSTFTFGHKAEGTLEMLTDLGAAHGFEVEGVALLKLGGRVVSSTSVRQALAEGDLAWPLQALGRRHVVEGQVVQGAGRGKGLGWPTANLQTPQGLCLPGRGVYAGRAAVDGSWWPAAINVGVNPTFGEEPLHVEAHLLGFEGDLGRAVLTVEFWERLRDEVRFPTPADLTRQIAEDVARTRELVGGP